MTTDTAGIREIDTGDLPDRYARGWHCLGPVKDYLDGKPHGVEIFGTMLVVFADSQGQVKDVTYDAQRSTLKDDPLQACITGKVKAWRFNISLTGADTPMPYTFDLSASGLLKP